MPTGYTAAVQEGISFEQFVWRCARAFGALIEMRDDSMDAPIPERFKPSDYHVNVLTKARERLGELRRMSVDRSAVEVEAQQDYQKAIEYKIEADAKDLDTLNKYNAMLSRVVQWQPPTPDHEHLKEFMLEQLHESKRFDCGHVRPEPELLAPDVWLEKETAKAVRDIEYHSKELEAEIERVHSRNKWIAALRESVNVPAN